MLFLQDHENRTITIMERKFFIENVAGPVKYGSAGGLCAISRVWLQVACRFYSKINISSILVPNTLAISCASFSEGLYLFFSRKTIVSLLTFTFFARSSWVRLNLARYSFILLFISDSPKVEKEPANSKDYSHPQYTGPNNCVCLIIDSVREIHYCQPQIE